MSATGEPGRLVPVDVVATDFPDAVPTLAALAALAPGESRLAGIGHLSWNESDRVESLADLITRAGARAVAGREDLIVVGPVSAVAGGAVRLPTAGDHRIAMAAALLSLSVPGLLIENPDCVGKSYPDFFRDLESLVRR